MQSQTIVAIDSIQFSEENLQKLSEIVFAKLT